MPTTKRSAASKNGIAPVFDFSYLEIEKVTKEFELPWLAGSPSLIVRPAGDSNPQYQEAILRGNAGRSRIGNANSVSRQLENLGRDRDRDYEMYPACVIVDWIGVKDSRGVDVEYTPENCEQFLRQLPVWIFDKARVFCLVPENFVDQPEVDVDALAKNS